MFGMNATQTEGQIRLFLGFFAGVAGALGWSWWGSVSDAFLATISPVFAAIGPIMYFATIVWSLISKKNGNLVAVAAMVPGVRQNGTGIALTDTPEGRALASVTPNNVNVTPGSLVVGPTGIGSGMR